MDGDDVELGTVEDAVVEVLVVLAWSAYGAGRHPRAVFDIADCVGEGLGGGAKPVGSVRVVGAVKETDGPA